MGRDIYGKEGEEEGRVRRERDGEKREGGDRGEEMGSRRVMRGREETLG